VEIVGQKEVFHFKGGGAGAWQIKRGDGDLQKDWELELARQLNDNPPKLLGQVFLRKG